MADNQVTSVPSYMDRFSKRTAFFIDYQDLQEILGKFYGRDEVEIMSLPNDSSLDFIVSGEIPDYDADIIQEAREDGGVDDWSVGILLNDMCRAGAIQPGRYIISVSWK